MLLAAPGTDIFGLGVRERGIIESGTSMAAPMVTGTAALIYAKYPASNTGHGEICAETRSNQTQQLDGRQLPAGI